MRKKVLLIVSSKFRSARRGAVLLWPLSLLCTVLGACGPNHPRSHDGTYDVEVLEQKLVSTPGGTGKEVQFHLNTVKFHYLENPSELKGKYYEFLVGAKLQFVKNWNTTGGEHNLLIENEKEPQIHYEIKEQISNQVPLQVIVPKDNFSLFILSTAYQIDFIFSSLEEATGLALDSLFSENKKLLIHYDASIVTGETLLEFGNAFYLPLVQSFALLKSSQEEDKGLGKETVGLSSSLSILGHESGHWIFEQLKGKDYHLDPVVAQFTKSYSLRGVDEGFADLLSWVISGNTSIFDSLITGNHAKDHLKLRDFSNLPFDRHSRILKCDQIHSYYCVGILFANSFYKSFLEMNYNPDSISNRSKAFRLLVAAIQKTWVDIRGSDLKKLHPMSDKAALSVFLDRVSHHISDEKFKDILIKNWKSNL